MNKDRIISVALVLIIIFKVVDLYIDFSNGVHTKHILQEVLLIAISLALFIYLMLDMAKRSINTSRLIAQLNQSKSYTEALNKQVLDTKQKFFDAIHAQFNDWKLTPSEKEVALLLVKGLSTSEIAAVSKKSEKTIGNQASAVYKKAHVSGRHELAALFFETLI